MRASRLGESIVIGVAGAGQEISHGSLPARHRAHMEGHGPFGGARGLHGRAEDRRLVHGRQDRDRFHDSPTPCRSKTSNKGFDLMHAGESIRKRRHLLKVVAGSDGKNRVGTPPLVCPSVCIPSQAALGLPTPASGGCRFVLDATRGRNDLEASFHDLRSRACLQPEPIAIAGARRRQRPGYAGNPGGRPRRFDSAGHRALVSLAQILNREMEEISITVMPTPGAAASVRGPSPAGSSTAIYGADVAFAKSPTTPGRYVGFEQGEHELTQSFWGLYARDGTRCARRGRRGAWTAGAPCLAARSSQARHPGTTRAALERAMNILEVGHNLCRTRHRPVGPVCAGWHHRRHGHLHHRRNLAGSLGAGSPADDGHSCPQPHRRGNLDAGGRRHFRGGACRPSAFDSDIGVEEAVLVPFYYGFHVGMNVDEDVVLQECWRPSRPISTRSWGGAVRSRAVAAAGRPSWHAGCAAIESVGERRADPSGPGALPARPATPGMTIGHDRVAG